MQHIICASCCSLRACELAWWQCRGGQHFDFDAQPSRNKAVYVNAHKGGTYVTPKEYMDTVYALQPDFYYTMADETFSPIPKRRSDNAAKRSARWLQACLDYEAPSWAAAQAPVPIGSIPGAAVAQQGRFVAQAATQHDAHLAGLCVTHAPRVSVLLRCAWRCERCVAR